MRPKLFLALSVLVLTVLIVSVANLLKLGGEEGFMQLKETLEKTGQISQFLTSASSRRKFAPQSKP